MSWPYWARNQRARVVAPPPPPVPGTFTATISSGAFTVQRDGSSERLITIVRTNYSEAIVPSITTLPSGVSGVFSPSTSTGAGATFALTLSAIGNASLVSNFSFTVTLTGPGVPPISIPCTISVIESVAPDAFTPNRPAGYVPLVDLTFDATFPSEPITTAAFLVYKGASISRFIPDRAQAIAGAGESGQYALRLKHLAGTGATYAGQVDLASVNVPANMRKAYIAWAFRLAPDFQFEVSGHKILYPKYVDNFTGHGQSPMLNLRFVGEDSFSDFWRWDVQQMYRWNGSDWTSVSNQNVGPTVNFQVNVDYRFEVQMEMETPGLGNGPADGIFRMWYSTWTGSGWSAPVLYMEYTNVRYANQTATFNRWNSLQFDVYRGGGGSPTLAADASMFFSRIYWGHQP